MPDEQCKWNRDDTLRAVSYLGRTRHIDRVVPLDDFDLEMAAAIREHMRIPGMGETTTRYFRDKLAMRVKAQEAGVPVPEFVHLMNHQRIQRFLDKTLPPWVLKPRFLAGAIGIRKVNNAAELWEIAGKLGDEQPNYVLERFVPGDIFHVDSIVYERKVVFACASRYGRPPLEVAHGGGIFTTALLRHGSKEEKALLALNRKVLGAMGLLRGVSHTEFIVAGGAGNGKLYFLETSARVGGAHIADMLEAGIGVNMWREWARVEIAGGQKAYRPPKAGKKYAGLLVSLARQERPDTSAYNDPEIVWRMEKAHHAGFIVASPRLERVHELLDSYVRRVKADFHASAPPRDRPSE
jgi:biotin carboxylase